MANDPFKALAYRLFLPFAERMVRENPRLRLSLQRAHIFVRPEMYLASYILLITTTFVVLVALLTAVFILRGAGVVPLPTNLTFLLVPLPFIVAFGLYVYAFLGPDLRAMSRARDIDAKLPYALNYIATMSSAGVTPDRIFTRLADQPIYGEVANEAALMRRDINVFGKDILTAMQTAIDRSPSTKFQDLLQGAVTALSSGGDLQQYLTNKSEQFMEENRAEQKGFLETLGVLAESFVTVVVAAPLFILVILSVMTTFGASSDQMLTIGYVLILMMLPLAHLGFAYTIKFVTPEV